MQLQDKIRSLPDSPGIYQYFDREGRLLYIGKAKSLRKRVKSYFRFTPSFGPSPGVGARIYKMLTETVKLEYIVVQSEHDALILENSLIKQLKPKYNILLRDDKTYPYIYVDLGEDFPRPEITRKIVKGKKIRYFGPFSQNAREILDAIYDLCKLVQKKACIKGKKACLFHQIGKCDAPCEGKITKEAYAKIVDEAIGYIQHRGKLIRKLEEKMLSYSEEMLFEEAAKMRDRIEKIKSTQMLSEIDLAKLADFDIFAVDIGENRACGVRLFIRGGKVSASSHTIFKSSTGFDRDELYRRLLLGYYQNELPYRVKEVLLYDDFAESSLIASYLEEKFGRKVQIRVPQKGEKRRVTELACNNAREILRMEAKKHPVSLYEELRTLLGLQNIPYAIETFDNSHMQGSATVGAMVRWEDGFDREAYRHYNLEAKDEYAQMRELLERRVDSFAKNPPPDLFLIDGGETLRRLAEKIVKKSGVYVDIVAIAKEKRDAKAMRAKGKAHDILYTTEGTLHLSPNDRRLQFLQRLRDEAHRFAITFHQKQKRKADQKITLLEKKGVGEATVRKLLQYFGTFENIQNATLQELTAVVGTNIAQNIKNISETGREQQ
ncbi:MAG TPA: excinuclease ABC subunit UvrC [Campylobacteraceae bacterium]|nr:excinuclease ABC subunit UvrC [Campylobacteraceae bacterium]